MKYAKYLAIWSMLVGPLAGGEQPNESATLDTQPVKRSEREEILASNWRWKKSPSFVALHRGEHIIWQFNDGPELNMPYFHPVATVSGRVLTSNEPPDHAWHHGTWFCWKFINGVNYWEHSGQTGKPEGRTKWFDVRVETRSDRSATISMNLTYQPAAHDDEVELRERRHIDISAPGADGVYRMDWTCSFTAGDQEVVLDRTPPKLQAWGGYAGLSVRFAKDFTERQVTNTQGPVEFGEGSRHRGHALATDYSGLIDGKAVGLAFLDHPGNPRHPTPWYAIRGPVMSYINAALLNDEPLKLKAAERMTLRYRLLIHPHRWDGETLREAHTEFRQAKIP